MTAQNLIFEYTCTLQYKYNTIQMYISDMRAGELGKLSAGILPVLNEGVLAERQALQAKPWKQQQPLTQVSQLESQDKAELLPVKEEVSSSSDDEADHIMEEVT